MSINKKEDQSLVCLVRASVKSRLKTNAYRRVVLGLMLPKQKDGEIGASSLKKEAANFYTPSMILVKNP